MISIFGMDKEIAQELLLQGVLESDIKKVKKALRNHAEINKHYDRVMVPARNGHVASNLRKSSALYVAMRNRDSEMAQFLVNNGANPMQLECETDTSFNVAIWNDDYAFIDAAIAKGYALAQLPKSASKPLFTAAFMQNEGMLDRLVELGADVNERNADGQTALYYLIKQELNHDWSGKEPIVKKLLNYGADIYDSAPAGVDFETTITTQASQFLKQYTSDLEISYLPSPGEGMDAARLVKDGAPTRELLQLASARLLPVLFSPVRWQGQGSEGLKLFEAVEQALPERYREQLSAVDLGPLRVEAASRRKSAGFQRFRSATDESMSR